MERNVPKLRFKGFNDEWEEYRIGDLCRVDTGNKDTQNKVDNGIYPFFVRSQNVERINTYSYDGEAILTAGDGVGVGKVFHYVNCKFDYHQRVYKLSDFNNVNGKFLYMYFSKNFKRETVKYNAKTSVDSVRREMITKMKIIMPSMVEQERIANFLTKVDKIIEKQDEKVKNLEKYKKGMIQKIFSQEIRFKDENGNEYPEWEETKLGELLTFYSTNSLSRECLNFEIGEVQNIHYGDIHMKFPTILDVKNYSIPYINSNIDITKYQEDSFCKDGDLIIADASEDYADIGKSIEVCNIGNKKILAGLHTILARDNKNLTSSGFKGYMMQCEFVRKQIKVLAAGAKVLGISKANLEKVNIKLPSLQEQQRIADFLTKMDLSIEKEYYKLKELKKWKKGLLQQMFV